MGVKVVLIDRHKSFSWDETKNGTTLSFLLVLRFSLIQISAFARPSDEKINTNTEIYKRERERGEKHYFLYIYIYDDAFYERVVVCVVVDGVAVVAKEYSREDGDFNVVEIIVRCEETREREWRE